MKNSRAQKAGSLPVQELLKGEYLHITRLHKDLNNLSALPHRHDHYELILSAEGKGMHSIDFKPYSISPDRLFFIQKGQVHLIESFERDGWIILFGEELMKRFLNIHPHENKYGILAPYTPTPFIDLDKDLRKILLLIVEQLITELEAEKQDLNLMLHYVSLLLLHANKAHSQQHSDNQLSLDNRPVFHQLNQLIETHFKDQHLAAFYAETLQMDIKKLNRICREATGLTLFQLLQERLLTECKIQLQTSTATVKEICYDLGFNDPAFFGKFFKKHTGVTPADFRNQRTI
ncbi:AraC family transcriptional regulator [Fulvivirga maritima]|uniref:AraC family transcriptional regulator n=1 Tax=Fulvivirga maritima TaxID=2904247 RepID=UPI001F1B10D2|nr:helix-turn-helix domain-containing protein [Fulvivirga maritima]UII25635.1 AraC family transcriptional regulator [Fulvivirga maritima]